jgi:hypothetical protein
MRLNCGGPQLLRTTGNERAGSVRGAGGRLVALLRSFQHACPDVRGAASAPVP